MALRRRRSNLTVQELNQSIEQKLRQFGTDYAGLTLREKVIRLAEVLIESRDLGVVVVRESGCDASGPRERIRLYLTQHTGFVVDGVELEVVSGISEYARRVRELRGQDGYKILTGMSNDPEMGIELKPSQYLLIDSEPDHEAAHRWHIANRIRKQSGGARGRILSFLQANVGKKVTSEELAYVARDAREFGRRTRELRTQDGYAVATRFTGRPDLKPGEYVLETLERMSAEHDRNIPVDVQKEVYLRDNNTCRICGWTRELWTRQDPRFLELHHVEHHAEGGQNSVENLLVLCSRCHDDVHAGRVVLT